jgi:hypothetical protein
LLDNPELKHYLRIEIEVNMEQSGFVPIKREIKMDKQMQTGMKQQINDFFSKVKGLHLYLVGSLGSISSMEITHFKFSLDGEILVGNGSLWHRLKDNYLLLSEAKKAATEMVNGIAKRRLQDIDRFKK